jgi:hypothetical protein
VSSYDLERPIIPSNKTIRAKLRRKRRQLGGVSMVEPSRQLAVILGSEPRTREEFVGGLLGYVQRIVSGVVPEKGWIEADDRIADLFYGRKRIRATDLKRIVTLNIKPLVVKDPEEPYGSLPGEPVARRMIGPRDPKNRSVTTAGDLPGIPVRKPIPPDIPEEEEDEDKKEEPSVVR